MIVALVVGLLSGFIQLFLIIKFASMLTGGMMGMKCMLLGILQFVLPAVVLIGYALLWRENLIWVGTGMVAALIVGAIIKLVISKHKLKGSDNKDV